MSAVYEKPELPVADPQRFSAVKSAIEAAFYSGRVADFFQSLVRGGLRVRDFESVLSKGLLGASAASEYQLLGNGDQGQIREFYLASLERVAPETRDKFFKLYAYY